MFAPKIDRHNPNYTRFYYESGINEVVIFGNPADHVGFKAIRAKAVNVGTRSSGPFRARIGVWKNLQFLETGNSLPFGKVLPVLACVVVLAIGAVVHRDHVLSHLGRFRVRIHQLLRTGECDTSN
jgi:hypothetical protein